MLNNLLNLVRMNLINLGRDDRGVTLLEYAAIAFLILVTCIIVIGLVGTNISTVWQSIADNLPGS